MFGAKLSIADVHVKGKVEVDKQQHLYSATNTMQAMYLFIQKLFKRDLDSSCGMMTTIQDLLKIY